MRRKNVELTAVQIGPMTNPSHLTDALFAIRDINLCDGGWARLRESTVEIT